MKNFFPHAAIFSWLCLSISGCGLLRIDGGVRVHADDWTTFGGNPQHMNVALHELHLPLAKLWEYDAGGGFGNTPVVVVDSLIFVGTLHGELHVVNLGTGKRVGSVDLGSAIMGTPIVRGELVYVALTNNEENLVAFNLQRGVPEWRSKIGDIETSPLHIDNRLYVATLEGTLLCLDQVDGEVVWTYEVPVQADKGGRGWPQDEKRKPIRSSPAADEGAIYFGADDGKLYAVRQLDGKLLWAFATRGNIVSSPSVYAGKVYFGSIDNTLYCLRASSGALVWKRDLGNKLFSSQAISEGRVYTTAGDGHVYCLDAVSGELHWTFLAKSVINSGPLIAGNIVFVGSLDKHLYALDAISGKLLWSESLPGRIKCSPVAWGDFLVVLVEDRSIIAFRSHKEKPS